MFRVKYLFGMLIGGLSLVPLMFATLGMKYTDGEYDRPITFIIFVVHAFAAVVLFISSYRDRVKEHKRLDELFGLLKEINGGRVPTDEFAEIAGISLEDAHLFLRRKSSNRISSYAINSEGRLIQPFDFEDKDF
ncbi:MAG: hypothetical protein V4642_03550 [Bacteroidota bacterium]